MCMGAYWIALVSWKLWLKWRFPQATGTQAARLAFWVHLVGLPYRTQGTHVFNYFPWFVPPPSVLTQPMKNPKNLHLRVRVIQHGLLMAGWAAWSCMQMRGGCIDCGAAGAPSSCSCTGAGRLFKVAVGRSFFNCHRENIWFSLLMNQPWCLSNSVVYLSVCSCFDLAEDRQMPVGRQTRDILDTRVIFPLFQEMRELPRFVLEVINHLLDVGLQAWSFLFFFFPLQGNTCRIFKKT